MSTAFDIISKWIPALDDLRKEMVKAEAELRALAAQYPDAADVFLARADVLAAQIASLDSALTPEGIANLAAAVVSELRNLITTGKLIPKSHPSDLA